MLISGQNIAIESTGDSNAIILSRELFSAGFFERLDLETSDELALFMAEHLEDYEPAVIQEFSESGVYTWTYILLHDIHMSTEAQAEVANLSLSYVDKIVNDPEKYSTRDSVYYYYLGEFTKWGERRIFSPSELDPQAKDFQAEIYMYVKQNGLPRILNMLRADMQDLKKADKAKEILLYVLGDLKNKGRQKPPAADADINQFYDAIFLEPGEYHLNTDKNKEDRVNMIKSKLDQYGVPEGGAISEFASGTGWLAGGLRDTGYSVNAFDRHPGMLDVATRDNPHVSFHRFDWNQWQEWDQMKESLITENSQDAVIINGRSIRHFQRSIFT